MTQTKKNWVDFKTTKEKVGMENVLIRYGLMGELQQAKNNLVGCCPIHKGTKKGQFSVNLERNIFNCFGDCKSGGNVLDFVAKMEKVSLHDAALLLQEWFPNPKEPETKPEKVAPIQEPKPVTEEKRDLDPPINTPLTFQLKNLDPEHAFFKDRGIETTTVEHFGLGLCSKGIMKGRIAIPIHDELGQLVAYCGQAVKEEQIEKGAKYKMPGNFKKPAVVYNLHRQKDQGQIVLVESFLSVFWLYQAGIKNVVALMGSELCDRQEELIVDTLGSEGQVVLLFDGDDDGHLCTQDCLKRLSKKLFVKALDISPHGRKPHQLTPEQIKSLL